MVIVEDARDKSLDSMNGIGFKKGEVRSLTGLRGLAALYVVWFHFVDPTSFSSSYRTFVAHGYLAVDLFFVLSGLVMAMNYKHMFGSGWSWASYVKFLGRRIARVYPLYVGATLFAYLMFRWSNPPGGLRYGSLGRMLDLNLIMVQSWGFTRAFSLDMPAWSISAEWAAYLIFPLLLIPTLFRKPLYGWFAGALSAAMLATMCLLPNTIRHSSDSARLLDFANYTFGLPVVRCISEFILGLLTFRVSGTAFGRRVQGRWFSVSIWIVLLVLLVTPKTDLAVVLAYPLLLLSLLSKIHIPARILSSSPFETLGILSYGIYLLHFIMGGLFEWMQSQGQLHGIIHAHSYVEVLRIPIILMVAFVTNRLIEAPSRRLLRHLFERDAIA
jgi:peptidoglycan/LPS O-acetylase OafA/YrhL